MKKLLDIKPLFVALLLVTAGCESLVSEIPQSKLPDAESKLVVQCFISPQSPRINVVVTESSPVFGGSGEEGGVVFADVKISDGTHEVVIPYDPESQLYSIERTKFPIVAGQTYKLVVTDGARSATATCRVPVETTTAKIYDIDTVVTNGGFSPDTALRLQMKWNDIAGQANYYRVRASVDLEYSVPEGSSPADFKERRIRNRFYFSWNETIGRGNFQSDANLDGQTFSSPAGQATLPRPVTYDFGSNNSFTVYPKAKIVSLTMEVYNTDENYFRYHRSIDVNRNSDNPFVEPSLVYTNVEGGLGCFAAFNSGQVTYRP